MREGKSQKKVLKYQYDEKNQKAQKKELESKRRQRKVKSKVDFTPDGEMEGKT